MGKLHLPSQNAWHKHPLLIFASLLSLLAIAAAAVWKDGEFTIEAVDGDEQEPAAARIRLVAPSGKPRKLTGLLQQGDSFLLDRPVTIRGSDGEYSMLLTRGLEYAPTNAKFELTKDANDETGIIVKRICNMNEEKWFSGDLYSIGRPQDVQRWMAAEELNIAGVVANSTTPPKPWYTATPLKLNERFPDAHQRWMIQWQANSSNTPSIIYFPNPTSTDETPTTTATDNEESAAKPPVATKTKPLFPEPNSLVDLEWLSQPQAKDAFVVATRPWSRDLPILLATDNIDAIMLLSTHLQAGKSIPIAKELFNPDPIRFTDERGLGRMSEYLYWQLLEAGFRIPPVAGSGLGEQASTFLGYNRVYAYLENDQTVEAWIDAMKRGRVLVTNGPLLRPEVSGKFPGDTFTLVEGEPLELSVGLKLTVADPVEYLEVVFNGQSLYQARLDEHAKKGGVIPPLAVKQSGWLLLRVVTGHESSYRLATTAPYYVEVSGKPRISRKAVMLFQKWLEHSIDQLRKEPKEIQRSYAPFVQNARKYWESKLADATVD